MYQCDCQKRLAFSLIRLVILEMAASEIPHALAASACEKPSANEAISMRSLEVSCDEMNWRAQTVRSKDVILFSFSPALPMAREVPGDFYFPFKTAYSLGLVRNIFTMTHSE